MGYQYVEIEKDGERGTCLPSALKTWEKHGWTVVEDGGEEKVIETTNAERPSLQPDTKPAVGDTEGEDQ